MKHSQLDDIGVEAIDLLAHPDFVRGACSVESVDGAVAFRRHPAGLLARFDQAEGSRIRARCTAGVRIVFQSDTRIVRLTMRYGDAVPWTKQYAFDLAVDGSPPTRLGPDEASTGATWSETIFASPERRRRTFALWLPHLAEGRIESLAVEKGAAVSAVPALRKRWLVIGDSITQGFVTPHPSQTYPALAAAALNIDHHNTGVGGGKADAAWAAAAVAVEARLITVALGINDYASKRTAEDFRASARDLMQGLRQARPDARICWITPIPYHTKTSQPNGCGLLIADYARIIAEQAAAVGGIEVIQGYALLPDEAQWYGDNCHPNAAGHEAYGRNLAVQLSSTQGLSVVPF